MGTEKGNVSFMREYLKYVVEFEKYVYIWTNSMNYANNQMRAIYAKRSKLEKVRNTTSDSLNTMDARLLGQQQYYAREAARFKKKATVALVVLMIDVLICLAIGAAMAVYGFDMKSAQADYHLSGAAIILISLLASVVTFIFTFIGPICLGIFCSNKSRCKKFAQQASTDAWKGSRRRQEIILNERKSQADNDWVVSVAEESVLSKKQEEISAALQTAKKNLANVYPQSCYMAGLIMMDYYKSLREAVPYFIDAAKHGNIAEAWHNLGWLCEQGAMNVSKEDIRATALGFYKSAAELGFVQSMDAVGRIYAAVQMLDEARVWIKRAANEGYEPAKKRLKMLNVAQSGSLWDLLK